MSKGKEEYIDVTLNQLHEQESAWEISLSDIIETDEYKALCPTPESCDTEDLSTLLYRLGMDTSYAVTSQIVNHRNWKGKVVNCERWVGMRRQDEEWLAFLSTANKFQNR